MKSTQKLLDIDGSQGEGGGQILRTTLSLSVVTGQGFVLRNIRAGRKKPGLMRQHLACVRAAEAISGAQVTGAELHSTELVFVPAAIRPGQYQFSIGSAGSTMLVLQTILPMLLMADQPSEVILEGGTHNPMAPSADFIQQGFLPLLQRLGAQVSMQVETPGFAPVGGGKVVVQVQPWTHLQPLVALLRGPLKLLEATATVLNLDIAIAQREVATLEALLAEYGLNATCRVEQGIGEGNALTVAVHTEGHTEVFSLLGEHGKSAEHIAKGMAGLVKRYLHQDAVMDEYLSDQVLLPMALVSWKTKLTSAFTTRTISEHTQTQAQMIERFLPVTIVLNGGTIKIQMQ